MLVRLEDITEDGLNLKFEEKPESFPALAELVEEGSCEFAAPIKVRISAFQVRELVEVEGRLDTRVRVKCSRCLADLEQPVAADFALTFTREGEPDGEGEEEGLELQSDDLGLINFQGEEFDLREALQEQVVMNLPYRPLCRERCRGLCSQCGADLNEGDCGCEKPRLENKFAALKDFKVDRRKK